MSLFRQFGRDDCFLLSGQTIVLLFRHILVVHGPADIILSKINAISLSRPGPIQVRSVASGRCAEKSITSSSVHGFRVSKRFYASRFQVGQTLDVVAERHYRQPKVGSRLPDRTNQFVTHLSDRRKYMLARARTLALR